MHKKKQENIFINPTFSLFCYCFLSVWHLFHLNMDTSSRFFDGFIRLHVPTVQSMLLFGISYFQFLALVECVPPFVTLRFFEFLPLKLAICNAFFYLVYFGVVKDSDRDDRP